MRLSHGDIVRWRAQLLVTGTCHVWMGAVGSDGYGRIAIRNAEDGARTLTPHQVGARLGYGPIPAGATVLHDCEVRLCCRAAPGHLRVGTQSENMRQAVARGRAVGPRPGRVDVRGKAGASRAIQAALLAAADRSPAALAAVLAAVIAEGDPWRDLHPLFDLPAHPAPAPVAAVAAFGCRPVGVLVSPRRRVPVGSLPLFDGVTSAARVPPTGTAASPAGCAVPGPGGGRYRWRVGVSAVIAVRTAVRLWKVNSAIRSPSCSGVSAVSRNVGRRSVGVPSSHSSAT